MTTLNMTLDLALAASAVSVIAIIITIFVLPANMPSANNIITSFRATGSGSGNALLTNAEEKSIVPLDQVVSGGPPPDGIPSIDNPKFVLVQEAEDKQTGSEWNFDGKGIDGQMKGKQLTRLSFDQGFWFEWEHFILKPSYILAKNFLFRSFILYDTRLEIKKIKRCLLVTGDRKFNH